MFLRATASSAAAPFGRLSVRWPICRHPCIVLVRFHSSTINNSGSNSSGPPQSTRRAGGVAPSGPQDPINTAASPTEGSRGNRFTRGNAGVRSSGGSGWNNSDGASSGGTSPSAASSPNGLFIRLSAPPDIRNIGSFTNYLQRVRSVARNAKDTSVSVVALYELQKISLPSIRGVDGNAILQCLLTLQGIGASAATPMVQDAAGWLCIHGASLPLQQLMQCFQLLWSMGCTDELNAVATALPQKVRPSTLHTDSSGCIAVLLCATLNALNAGCCSTALISFAEALVSDLSDHSRIAAIPRQELLNLIIVVLGNATIPVALLKGEVRSGGGGVLEISSPSHSAAALLSAWTQLVRGVQNAMVCIDTAAISLDDLVRLLQCLCAAFCHSTDAVVQATLQQYVSDIVRRMEEEVEEFSKAAACATSGAFPSLESRQVLGLLNVFNIASGTATGVAAVAVPEAEKKANDAAMLSPSSRSRLVSLRVRLLDAVAAFAAVPCPNIGVADLVSSVSHWLVEEHRTNHLSRRAAAERSVLLPSGRESEQMAGVDLAVVLPQPLLDGLVCASASQLLLAEISWTPLIVQHVSAALSSSSDATHQKAAVDLVRKWYTQLQARAQSGERIQPLELLSLLLPSLLVECGSGVAAALKTSLARWSVSEVLFFFKEAARSPSAESRAVLRDAATVLCGYAKQASSAQLAALVDSYALTEVRHEEFFEVASSRLLELLGSSSASSLEGTSAPLQSDSSVTLSELCVILSAFAIVESRQAKPFVEAAPYIIRSIQSGIGTSEQITRLLAAYAKLLVLSYPIYRLLVERLLVVASEEPSIRLRQLVTAQLALIRMDLQNATLTAALEAALRKSYCSTNATDGDVALRDVVVHLSVLSRVVRETDATSKKGGDAGCLSAADHGVAGGDALVACMASYIVQRQDQLQVHELAEVLLSLARLGMGKSTYFDDLTVRALGMVPTAPPRCMAYVAEAYALAGRGDDVELFTLMADRTIAMRHDIAAVTIGSILASFAAAGVRNDRLYIEVIPQVRHVATYGSPRDVVNVVYAYATVNLWHYKLFARLADRAIQLRADFHTPQLVRLLAAYAMVQMRYDRLFTELAPRLQTVSHLLTAAEVASVVNSYNSLAIPCLPVMKACAARAKDLVGDFTETEGRMLLEALADQQCGESEIVALLIARFPALSAISFGTSETESGGGAENGGAKDLEDAEEVRHYRQTQSS